MRPAQGGAAPVPLAFKKLPAPWRAAAAALTGVLTPYFTAFGDPGFYPYNSATSILVSGAPARSPGGPLHLHPPIAPQPGLAHADVHLPGHHSGRHGERLQRQAWRCACVLRSCLPVNTCCRPPLQVVKFRLARYQDGHLLTEPREIAERYLQGSFWLDFGERPSVAATLSAWGQSTAAQGATCALPRPAAASVFPFDEVALAVAGLSGAHYVNNPQLAECLSLLRLLALVRRSAAWRVSGGASGCQPGAGRPALLTRRPPWSAGSCACTA